MSGTCYLHPRIGVDGRHRRWSGCPGPAREPAGPPSPHRARPPAPSLVCTHAHCSENRHKTSELNPKDYQGNFTTSLPLFAAFTIAVSLPDHGDGGAIVRGNGVSSLGFRGGGGLTARLTGGSGGGGSALVGLGWFRGSLIFGRLTLAGRLLIPPVGRGPQSQIVTEQLHDEGAVSV